MGTGYDFKCPQCGARYDVYPGIGMMQPALCKELIEKIRSGKKGKAWKEAYDRYAPYVATGGERCVFVCDECGRWREAVDTTLYAPDDIEKAKEEYKEKRVEEDGCIPYLSDKKGFHVVKPFVCRCTKCKKNMRKAAKNEIRALPCPKCGAKNEARGLIMWD